MNTAETVIKAGSLKKCIPAFNCPHIPMVKPICEAIRDENSAAMIQAARLDWDKFSAGSLEAVAEEYEKHKAEGHTLLHLDHIPVIDEDMRKIDYMELINRGLKAGYASVMVDGSRLSLEDNISVTREVTGLAHEWGVPVEAELGSVMGHEAGEMPPYEEIFAAKKGFTKPEEARRFAEESGCDWLSVACGNIHGRIAEAVRNQKKPEAKLDVEHIGLLSAAAGIPLVLHGRSGVKQECLLDAFKAGIAKINVGTELRQTYEFALEERPGDIEFAREKVYLRTRDYIRNFLYNSDLADLLK